MIPLVEVIGSDVIMEAGALHGHWDDLLLPFFGGEVAAVFHEEIAERVHDGVIGETHALQRRHSAFQGDRVRFGKNLADSVIRGLD